MNITFRDYLELVKELMAAVGYLESHIEQHFVKIQKGTLNLDDFSANVAVQCFIKKHSSANADIVRAYLIERQKTGKVEFAK